MSRSQLNRRTWLNVSALLAILLFAAGCGGTMSAPSLKSERSVPAAADLPAATVAMPYQDDKGLAVTEAPDTSRKIIKTAEISLRVNDTQAGIDQVTALATEFKGYILSSRTWYESEAYMATITLGIPSSQFEPALARLRAVGIKVLSESSSGQDVTSEFVDLEARLRNLEVTQARVRGFMEQTVSVEEALDVNRQLSEVEGQIEQVKGRMQYLQNKADYSSVTVSLYPETSGPTPASLTAWDPGHTFGRATHALLVLLRFLGDAAIWVGVVLLPLFVPLAIVAWLLIGLQRRRRQRRTKADKA